MPDPFKNTTPDLLSPAIGVHAVVPSDSTDLPDGARALWVGTAGHVSVTDSRGNTVTLKNASGLIGPFRIVRVNATGTTAGDIVAFV